MSKSHLLTRHVSSTSQEAEKKFKRLSVAWRKETRFQSTMIQIAMHPAYQQIIGMGQAALPLIFRDLAKKPDHWFWALTAITGETPIPDEDKGDMERMTRDWLTWAARNGYEA